MTRKLLKGSVFTFLASLGLVGLYMLVAPQSTSAQYIENNLVDDTIFLDAASMSQAQIQSFLEARGSYLATYSSYSGRDGTNVLASRIIYEAAQDYGMNPKVILATLQKEQSLVTATNPSASQLQKAMGYGCPDSASCDTKYYGLYNQVDNGAWQFRKNFERARGNTSWWSSSPGYACGGTTRYYSTGLYAGRNVTFYDDSGAAIKNFTLNNASSASLYCYTPHPYNNPNGLYGNPAYGYTGQYYSGSYNFVVWFERWFGSTQPSVVISSPLRVAAVRQGVYSGAPVRASFDISNNTNAAINVGGMAVTVRDANGGNFDYLLKQMTVPAWSTITYSDTKVFPAEGSYTFGLTTLSNGVWNEGYPVSNNIDNPRAVTYNLRAMPTVTVAPALGAGDVRVGKATDVTFTVKNNSASVFDIGKLAIALRSPTGANVDLPLVPSGSIAAGGTFTYIRSITPSQTGTYTGFITATTDNGIAWNEVDYPAQASGIARTVSFNAKPNPTLTQGPAVSVTSPRVGQQVTSSFKIRNFGDTTANVGYVGMAIRDPNGRNVDAGGTTVSVNANSEYTFQASSTFQTPGVYSAWITSYRNGVWDDNSYPIAESGSVTRRVNFTVLPNPTLTQGPAVSVTSPRVGQQVTSSFKIRNFGDTTANVGYVGMAIRDPNGRNVDAGGTTVSVNANSEYTFQASSTFQTPGVYSAWITSYRNGVWDDNSYPIAESGSVTRRVNFTVLPNPTVIESLVSSTTSPTVNQQFTVSFKLKNFTASSVDLGYIGVGGRNASNQNVDLGTQRITLAAGEEKTVTFNAKATNAGVIRYFVLGTNDFNTWNDGPVVESGSVIKTINITAHN